MLIGVIDLGINNLTSVQKSFSEKLENTDKIVVIDSDLDTDRPDLIILPGLGKFGAGMKALVEKNLDEKIKGWNRIGSKVVGICLGMQLLGTKSEESDGVEGLGLIPGVVERLPANQDERVPHTGWAESIAEIANQPFSSLSTQGDFYFVHSYHLVPKDKESILTRTSFGDVSFVSGVYSEDILGFQFHPEKSGKKGKQLVAEIIAWGRNES